MIVSILGHIIGFLSLVGIIIFIIRFIRVFWFNKKDWFNE